MFKAIAYAFPTSSYARRFKRYEQGCYVVELSTDYRNPNPKRIDGPFDTLEAAERHANAIDAEWSPFTRRAA